MPFGTLDTQYIDFPAGVDATYLQGLRTRAGVSFAEVLRALDAVMRALNTRLDPLVASLITPTTEAFVDGSSVTAFMVDERAEYTVARPQLAEGQAIMLPIKGYDVSLEFTEDGLEAMSRSRIDTNIESAAAGFRALYRRKALQRLLSDAEVRVDNKTVVTSPGFAGSGTGDNVFSRAYPDGTALPGGYTHYYVADTDNAGELKTVLLAAVARLRKWHKGPFDLIANAELTGLITAITGTSPADSFVSAGSPLVRPAQGSVEAMVDANMFVGVLFGDVRVHMAITDTASSNIAIFKSYGALSPQNPLAWRYDELKGRNAFVRYRSLYPLDQAVVKQDFGIGVNDRTAAVLIFAESAATDYESPTDL